MERSVDGSAAQFVGGANADAAPDRPPRPQALLAEDGRALVVQAVQLLGLVALLTEIDRLRRSALHLERQLVTGDARLQGGIPPPFGGMLVVVGAERVEQVALGRLREMAGPFQVEDRRRTGAEHRALVLSRHVAARPV